MNPAGWYTDPGGSGKLRWWDGAVWTHKLRESDKSSRPAPVRTRPTPTRPGQNRPASTREDNGPVWNSQSSDVESVGSYSQTPLHERLPASTPYSPSAELMGTASMVSSNIQMGATRIKEPRDWAGALIKGLKAVLLLVVILAVIAGALWYFFGRSAQPAIAASVQSYLAVGINNNPELLLQNRCERDQGAFAYDYAADPLGLRADAEFAAQVAAQSPQFNVEESSSKNGTVRVVGQGVEKVYSVVKGEGGTWQVCSVA